MPTAEMVKSASVFDYLTTDQLLTAGYKTIDRMHDEGYLMDFQHAQMCGLLVEHKNDGDLQEWIRKLLTRPTWRHAWRIEAGEDTLPQEREEQPEAIQQELY